MGKKQTARVNSLKAHSSLIHPLFAYFNSTNMYKDIKNINIKSIFKLSITVFDSIVSPPCR